MVVFICDVLFTGLGQDQSVLWAIISSIREGPAKEEIEKKGRKMEQDKRALMEITCLLTIL